jgi:GNAT superfamily N-acetyltransferase
MHIIEVNPRNRRDVKDFLKLPFHIYKDIPQWVPPLMPGERARFKPDFAFYTYSEAAFFLVRDDGGQAIGRVAVLEHRPHNDYRHNKDALLYLYESINDDEVARLLFKTAEDWARSRGLNRLVGPKGFLSGDGLGLLVKGFEHRPAIGIPYNPAYYSRQWVDIGGMEKELDYVSAWIDREKFVKPERIMRIAAKVKERSGFHVPTFRNKAQMRPYAEKIRQVYNEAFSSVWAYTPIPAEELEAITDKLFQIADPPLMKVLLKDGKVAGLTFCYPDISEGIQKIKGEIWPFGWMVLLAEKRRTKWLNANGNAVLPEYQGLGANAVLYAELVDTLLNKDYQGADVVQIQENNTRMLADLQQMAGAEVHKVHRVYKKHLT